LQKDPWTLNATQGAFVFGDVDVIASESWKLLSTIMLVKEWIPSRKRRLALFTIVHLVTNKMMCASKI